MKLYSNPASPFARKALVIAHELDLKLEVIATSPFQDESFRHINPLGKIPALVLDDGSVLIDSPVICEYLNHYGGGKFFPGMSLWRQNSGRWKALCLQALGDGIGDAAVTFVTLGHENPVPETARARSKMAVLAGLDALERTKFAEYPTIGEVAVACSIGYLDFRLPDLDWRASRPRLAGWYAKFCEYPAMKATQPK